jgi:hypothetical protein
VLQLSSSSLLGEVLCYSCSPRIALSAVEPHRVSKRLLRLFVATIP